ncbi:hypothetical protein DFJ74DRAFT_771347 [Hyaloraphidium curvatum]|nr:hypothetical protein DFJ74DRAFT_771347 [Hyaloraphidium curvatum]
MVSPPPPSPRPPRRRSRVSSRVALPLEAAKSSLAFLGVRTAGRGTAGSGSSGAGTAALRHSTDSAGPPFEFLESLVAGGGPQTLHPAGAADPGSRTPSPLRPSHLASPAPADADSTFMRLTQPAPSPRPPKRPAGSVREASPENKRGRAASWRRRTTLQKLPEPPLGSSTTGNRGREATEEERAELRRGMRERFLAQLRAEKELLELESRARERRESKLRELDARIRPRRRSQVTERTGRSRAVETDPTSSYPDLDLPRDPPGSPPRASQRGRSTQWQPSPPRHRERAISTSPPRASFAEPFRTSFADRGRSTTRRDDLPPLPDGVDPLADLLSRSRFGAGNDKWAIVEVVARRMGAVAPPAPAPASPPPPPEPRFRASAPPATHDDPTTPDGAEDWARFRASAMSLLDLCTPAPPSPANMGPPSPARQAALPELRFHYPPSVRVSPEDQGRRWEEYEVRTAGGSPEPASRRDRGGRERDRGAERSAAASARVELGLSESVEDLLRLDVDLARDLPGRSPPSASRSLRPPLPPSSDASPTTAHLSPLHALTPLSRPRHARPLLTPPDPAAAERELALLAETRGLIARLEELVVEGTPARVEGKGREGVLEELMEGSGDVGAVVSEADGVAFHDRQRAEIRQQEMEQELRAVKEELKESQKVPFLMALAALVGLVGLPTNYLYCLHTGEVSGTPTWIGLLAATFVAIPTLYQVRTRGVKKI